MAGQPTVTSSLSSSPASSTQHDTAAQDLRAQLQAATRQIHKLKREKAWELKQLQDNHQKQLSVALKDQKCTLHKEKQKDWEHQKETLMKRHEVEMQKSLKVRDAELAKLRSTVKHLQDELKESIQKNMSVVARGTFENEKGQLVAEVRDLRNQRRELESRLAGAQEEVNHKLNEIVQLKDTHSKQLEKQKRDASLEVRRLLDELRGKERENVKLEKESSRKEQKLQLIQSNKKPSRSGSISGRGESMDSSGSFDQEDTPQSTPRSSSTETDKLNLTIERLSEEIQELNEENEELVGTIEALQCACMEKDQRIEVMNQRLRKCRNKSHHRVRFNLPNQWPARPQIAGLQETYFGYEEDPSSVESSEVSSEMTDSQCSASSSIPDDIPCAATEADVAESASELAKNMQRLVREHLELEKAFCLLQARSPLSVEPTPSEDVDMAVDTRLQVKLADVQEQNEELEFRILELEEANAKLLEECHASVEHVGTAPWRIGSRLSESEDSGQMSDLELPPSIEMTSTDLPPSGLIQDEESPQVSLETPTRCLRCQVLEYELKAHRDQTPVGQVDLPSVTEENTEDGDSEVDGTPIPPLPPFRRQSSYAHMTEIHHKLLAEIERLQGELDVARQGQQAADTEDVQQFLGLQLALTQTQQENSQLRQKVQGLDLVEDDQLQQLRKTLAQTEEQNFQLQEKICRQEEEISQLRQQLQEAQDSCRQLSATAVKSVQGPVVLEDTEEYVVIDTWDTKDVVDTEMQPGVGDQLDGSRDQQPCHMCAQHQSNIQRLEASIAELRSSLSSSVEVRQQADGREDLTQVVDHGQVSSGEQSSVRALCEASLLASVHQSISPEPSQSLSISDDLSRSIVQEAYHGDIDDPSICSLTYETTSVPEEFSITETEISKTDSHITNVARVLVESVISKSKDIYIGELEAKLASHDKLKKDLHIARKNEEELISELQFKEDLLDRYSLKVKKIRDRSLEDDIQSGCIEKKAEGIVKLVVENSKNQYMGQLETKLHDQQKQQTHLEKLLEEAQTSEEELVEDLQLKDQLLEKLRLKLRRAQEKAHSELIEAECIETKARALVQDVISASQKVYIKELEDRLHPETEGVTAEGSTAMSAKRLSQSELQEAASADKDLYIRQLQGDLKAAYGEVQQMAALKAELEASNTTQKQLQLDLLDKDQQLQQALSTLDQDKVKDDPTTPTQEAESPVSSGKLSKDAYIKQLEADLKVAVQSQIKIECLEAELAEYKQREALLQLELQQKENFIDQLKKKLKDANAPNAELEEKEDHIGELSDRITSLNKEVHLLRQASLENEPQIDKSDQAVYIKQLEADLKVAMQYQSKVEGLEAEIQQKVTAIDQLKKSLEDANSISADLEEKEEHISELSEHIATLNKEIDLLKQSPAAESDKTQTEKSDSAKPTSPKKPPGPKLRSKARAIVDAAVLRSKDTYLHQLESEIKSFRQAHANCSVTNPEGQGTTLPEMWQEAQKVEAMESMDANKEKDGEQLVDKLQKELNNCHLRETELLGEIDALRSALEENQKQQKLLEKQVQENQPERRRLQDAVDSTGKERAELEEQLFELQQDHAGLQEEASIMREDIQKLQHDNQKLERDLHNKRKLLHEARLSFEEMVQEQKSGDDADEITIKAVVEPQTQAVQTSNQILELKEHQEELASLEKKNKEAKSEELGHQIETLKKLEGILREEIRNKDEQINSISNLSGELESEKESNSRLTEENKALKLENGDLKIKLKGIKAMQEALGNEHQEEQIRREKQLETLKAKLSKAEQSETILKESITELEDIELQLKTKLKQCDPKKCDQFVQEIEDLHIENEQLESKILDFQSKEKSLQKDVSDLTDKLNTSESIIKKLVEKEKVLLNQISELSQTRDKSANTIKELTEEENKLQTRIRELIENDSTSQKQIKELSEKETILENQITKLRSKEESARNELQQLLSREKMYQEQIENYKKDVVDAKVETVSAAEQEFENKTRKISDLENVVKKLVSREQALLEEVQSLQTEKQELEENSRRTEQQTDEEVANLADENKVLKRQLVKLKMDTMGWVPSSAEDSEVNEEVIVPVSRDSVQMVQSIPSSKAPEVKPESTNQEDSMDSLRQQLADLEEQLEVYEDTFKKNHRHMQNLQDQVDTLQLQLTEQDKVIDYHKDEISEQQKEIEELVSRLKESELARNKLKESLKSDPQKGTSANVDLELLELEDMLSHAQRHRRESEDKTKTIRDHEETIFRLRQESLDKSLTITEMEEKVLHLKQRERSSSQGTPRRRQEEDYDEAVEKYLSEIAEKNSALGQRDLELAEKKEEVQRLEALVVDLRTQSEDEADHYETELKQRHLQLEQLQEDLKEAQDAVAQLQEELEVHTSKQQADTNAYKVTLKQKDHTLQVVESSLQDLSSQKQQLEEALTEQLDALKHQLQEKNNEAEDSAQQAFVMEEKVKVLVNKVRDQQSQLDVLQAELTAKTASEERLLTQVDALEEARAMLRAELEDTVVAHEETMEATRATLQDLAAKKDSIHDEEELSQLSRKVQELMDAEGHLLDQIQEHMDYQEALKTELSHEKDLKAQVQEELDMQRSVMDDRLAAMKELELQHQAGRVKINQLELELRKLSTMDDLQRKYEASLRRITDLEDQNAAQTKRINQLEKCGEMLLTKVEDYALGAPTTSRKSPVRKTDDTVAVYTAESNVLDSLPRDTLVQRLSELQAQGGEQRRQILELQGTLAGLRELVEDLTASWQQQNREDSNGKHGTGFEARVLGLVKSEVALHVKVLDLEASNKQLRTTLVETEARLRDTEAAGREAISDLEEEIDKLRLDESRLKHGSSRRGSDSLSRLQSRVAELEQTNRQLRRQVLTLEDTEHTLQRHIDLLRTPQVLPPHRDTYTELLAELQLLKVPAEGQSQGAPPGSPPGNQSPRSSLKQQVRVLEEQGACYSAPTLGTHAGSPDPGLRKRLRHLEKIERHQKQQIQDLQHAQEELHDLASKDKDLIHDLNVHIRQLTSTQAQLNKQVHELEVEDDELRHQVEDLSSRLEETQASLSRSRVAEKEARAQMHEAQGQEVTIQQTYLTQLEDLRAAEAKGRRRVAELEQEKRELQDKLDEQCEQLSDLEASENACRQRLRSVESQEVELEVRITELEQAETRAKLRAVEVESQSDELAVKLQKADTDKLSLETALQLAEADSTKLQLERDQLRFEKEKLMKEKEELEVEKEQLEAEKEKLEDVQAHLEDHKEALEERVKQLDNAKTALAAALDSMEEMRDTSVEAADKLQLENTQLQGKLAAAEASLETYKKQETADNLAESSFLRLQLSQLQQDFDALKEEHLKCSSVQPKPGMIATVTHEVTAAAPPPEPNKDEEIQQMKDKMQQLQQREHKLHEVIAELSQGKSECGHEWELDQLRAQQALHEDTIQAHELLKQNYESVQQKLQQAAQATHEAAKSCSSKSVQVHLAQAVTLQQITPELKTAIQQLGKRHPEAYAYFVHHLQPRANSQPRPTAMRHKASPTEGSTEQKTGDTMELLSTEDPLWKKVEGKSPNEETYWANIERTTGDLDEMTLSLTFHDEYDSASDSGVDHRYQTPESRRHLLSPHGSFKPGSSYDSLFLPSRHEDDGALSADEASEIDIDDNFTLRKPRAKSVDRESEMSDMMLSISPRTPSRRSRTPYFTGSLDSIPDSGLGTLHMNNTDMLRDKITHLTRQLKARERELEAAREKIADLEGRVRLLDMEDLSPRGPNEAEVQLKEELEKMEKELQSKTNDLASLNTELQRRQYALDQESAQRRETLRNLEAAQAALSQANATPDQSQELEDALKKARADLQEAIAERELMQRHLHESQADHIEATTMREEAESRLAKVKADLAEAHEQGDRMATALHKAKADLETAMEGKEQAELALQVARDALEQKGQDAPHAEDETQVAAEGPDNLREAEEEKAALQKIVVKLRGQVADLERTELERQQLQQQLEELQQQYTKLKNETDKLTHDKARLLHQHDTMEQALQEKQTSSHKEPEPSAGGLSAAEALVTPLRARVVRLSQLCKNKDDLISRLVQAGHEHDAPANLLDEAETMLAQSPSQEHHRPLSPLPTRPKQIFDTVHIGETLSSENDTPVAAPSVHIQPSTAPVVSLEPPPQQSLAPVTLLGSAKDGEARHKPAKAASAPKGGPHIGEVCSVVKDYDPKHFSSSGKQESEIPLVEGQSVKIVGPVESSGYVTVEVEGCVGLVPATHLMSQSPHAPTPPRRSKKVKSYHGAIGSPEQILDMHAQLQESQPPFKHLPTPPASRPASTYGSITANGSISHPAFSRANPLSPRRKLVAAGSPRQLRVQMPLIRSSVVEGMAPAPNTAKLTPEPPSALRVQRRIGHSCIMLAWSPPTLDPHVRSNGIPVTGYRLLIDGREQQQIRSAYLSRAVVEHLDLTRPHQFSLQTLGAQGQASAAVDAVFDDLLPPATDADIEDASIFSGPATDEGDRKVFLAIYDYRPEEQSPNAYPGEELSFKAGDILTTYGSQRPDGFYLAKAHGRKGLAPASFMEEVALLRSRSQQSLAGSST